LLYSFKYELIIKKDNIRTYYLIQFKMLRPITYYNENLSK